MQNPDTSSTVQQRAFAALFIGAGAIAFSPIFVRMSELGPSATAFYRVFFAIPVLWIWVYISNPIEGQHRHPSSPGDYIRLTLAGLFFSCDLAVWHWSIKLTSVANSTLLANAAPIFVTFGAFFLFGEKFSNTFENKIEKIIQSIESQEKARVPGSKRIKNYKVNANTEISIKEELYNKIIALNK